MGNIIESMTKTIITLIERQGCTVKAIKPFGRTKDKVDFLSEIFVTWDENFRDRFVELISKVSRYMGDDNNALDFSARKQGNLVVIKCGCRNDIPFQLREDWEFPFLPTPTGRIEVAREDRARAVLTALEVLLTNLQGDPLITLRMEEVK